MNKAKKNKPGSGSLFSPEFQEVVSRLKRKEPELEEIIKRKGKTTRRAKQ